jgi:hypothetical protein
MLASKIMGKEESVWYSMDGKILNLNDKIMKYVHKVMMLRRLKGWDPRKNGTSDEDDEDWSRDEDPGYDEEEFGDEEEDYEPRLDLDWEFDFDDFNYIERSMLNGTIEITELR